MTFRFVDEGVGQLPHHRAVPLPLRVDQRVLRLGPASPPPVGTNRAGRPSSPPPSPRSTPPPARPTEARGSTPSSHSATASAWDASGWPGSCASLASRACTCAGARAARVETLPQHQRTIWCNGDSRWRGRAPHRRGQGLPRRRPRRLEPAGDRLVDRRPYALQAGRRRPPDGHLAPARPPEMSSTNAANDAESTTNQHCSLWRRRSYDCIPDPDHSHRRRVEPESEAAALRALGVGSAQGYLIGRPAPLQERTFGRIRLR